MRSSPAAYHVLVTWGTGSWRGRVQAWNRTDAAFRAGQAAQAAGTEPGLHAVYYIHRDDGAGCCREAA
jgi:hypothetical protein